MALAPVASPDEKHPTPDDALAGLAQLLKGGGDPLRLAILRTLGHGSFGVLELCEVFGLKHFAADARRADGVAAAREPRVLAAGPKKSPDRFLAPGLEYGRVMEGSARPVSQRELARRRGTAARKESPSLRRLPITQKGGISSRRIGARQEICPRR